MSIPLSQLTVPLLLRALDNLSHILRKGEAHQADTGDSLVQARLAADMFPLSGQIQGAADAAKACIARLAGVEPPRFADTETTYAELQERIAKTVAFIHSVPAALIDADTVQEITLKLPSGSVTMAKDAYLYKMAIPNFYFHVVTAYAILRKQGVALGKMDYLGALGD